MTSPLVSSLSLTIGKALSSTFLPATLTRPSETLPDVNYPCKAIVDQLKSPAGSVLNASASPTIKIIILASTLAVRPQSWDRITVRGEVFTILPNGKPDGYMPSVQSDPARAAWTCMAVSLAA